MSALLFIQLSRQQANVSVMATIHVAKNDCYDKPRHPAAGADPRPHIVGLTFIEQSVQSWLASDGNVVPAFGQEYAKSLNTIVEMAVRGSLVSSNKQVTPIGAITDWRAAATGTDTFANVVSSAFTVLINSSVPEFNLDRLKSWITPCVGPSAAFLHAAHDRPLTQTEMLARAGKTTTWPQSF